jgi:hypothetical protein
MWFLKKKRAEHSLQELVDGLSQSLGSGLLSVVLYGSKASGEYREGSSDVNVFFVVADMSAETLERMAKPMGQWCKAGHPMPVFIQKNELSLYARSLPIEFLDMQDHHKVIFGSNPFEGLTIDRVHLRAQCLQELCVKLSKLRQAILIAGGNAKRLRGVLLESLPSVLTIYRAILRLEAEVPKAGKIVAARALSERVGIDGECLERLWNNHIRRETDNVQDLAHHYLDGMERVLVYLGRK